MVQLTFKLVLLQILGDVVGFITVFCFLFQNVKVKKISELVYICQSYPRKVNEDHIFTLTIQ